jgi:valyl-tRNA synthetase
MQTHSICECLMSLCYWVCSHCKGKISQAKRRQAAKKTEELLSMVSSIRKEREQIEESARTKEERIKLEAEKELRRYKDDIQKLEKEIAQIRQKSDSSKIAALKRGIDGSYAGSFKDTKKGSGFEEPHTASISELVQKLNNFSMNGGGVKRERECVMCLSEEMSVVFLPCAHQVVCTKCNELHEKQGMQDCPSCRSPIQERISVRYART